MKNRLLVFILIFSCLFLCCCKKNEVFKTNKLRVCTSFYTVYDFVQKIGGDRVEIVNLIPAGVEPHDFEPSPKDLVTLSKSDVLICNGLGMESWIDKIKKSVNNLKVVEIADGLGTIEGDPHVWLNPMNVKDELNNIKNVLVELDNDNKEYYEKNYNKYEKDILNLDREYENRLSNCAKSDIVVTHSAFGYLCHRYGLKQISLQGVLNDGEPSIKNMTDIINIIRDNDIKTVFWEDEKDKKVMKTIENETGVSILRLETLENMTKEDIKNGRDYFGIMLFNLDNLVSALEA